MQNGSIMRSERRRGPDVWEYRWREPVRTVGANTAEWSSDQSPGLGTKMQPDAQSARYAGTSTWRTFAAKGSPSLYRSWPITTLSVSLPLIVDGNALYEVGVSRLPAQVDHSAMG